MNANLESAILDALHQYPEGFPVAGSQLAERLHVSHRVVLDTATAMGQLPRKYDDGLVIVTTVADGVTHKPAGFYVQFQPFENGFAQS